MSWSWSHTQEAYNHIYREVHNLSREHLIEIYAEWESYFAGGGSIENPPTCPDDCGSDFAMTAAKQHATTLPKDILADVVWERMLQQARCDNGGFNAYACPYGCHTVQFP